MQKELTVIGSGKIHLDLKYYESGDNSLSPPQSRQKIRASFHEAIHKLANRNGFLTDNTKKFTGLIEGGTEKICEDRYGDKTSHTKFIGDSFIHFNFSREASYPLSQVIYRQMAQLVQPGIADKSTIRGDGDFFNEFANLYGRDLFLYANHRASRCLKDRLPDKQKVKYLQQAQKMILTKAFDKKLLSVQNEEDMISYMTELRDFESATATIDSGIFSEKDFTFQKYYSSKYNSIIQLAQQKGIDLSKLEQFQYSPADGYPIRNFDRLELSEITKMHIRNLLEIEEYDLNKCTRMQIQKSANFYHLDIILQEGVPISIVEDDYYRSDMNCIEDEEWVEFYRQKFGIDDKKSKIYNIASNVYMIIRTDKTSEIYFDDTREDKIQNLTGNQIVLDISQDDIEATTIDICNRMDSNDIEGDHTTTLFGKFKNFFGNLFLKEKNQLLSAPSKDLSNDASNINNAIKAKTSFAEQLNFNNPIYRQDTVVPIKKTELTTEKTIDDSIEIENKDSKTRNYNLYR